MGSGHGGRGSMDEAPEPTEGAAAALARRPPWATHIYKIYYQDLNTTYDHDFYDTIHAIFYQDLNTTNHYV